MILRSASLLLGVGEVHRHFRFLRHREPSFPEGLDDPFRLRQGIGLAAAALGPVLVRQGQPVVPLRKNVHRVGNAVFPQRPGKQLAVFHRNGFIRRRMPQEAGRGFLRDLGFQGHVI